ncbi:MAG: glycosyltransferase, partial [Abditibacteriota bacterium]|nr:glycosyltransferase [Abditibacteriota bacterium]
MPKVSVAIVSWNTKDLVLDCLRSLYERTKDIDFEVFLVDNRSSDGTLEAVQKAFPQVDAIDSGGNLGFAKANNIALRKSTGKYFLLLNPDTVLTDNSVKELADFMDKT